MVSVGIIGCGYRGSNLVRVFSDCESTSVAAVCDTNVSRVKSMRSRYPGIEGYTRSDELIARDEIDLVVVATPVDAHFPVARDAILHGKHVLVEKPFTRDSAQAEKLIELADRQGVVLAVDHPCLFTPAVEKIKELIEGGEIGALMYIDAVRINTGLIPGAVNVIWDLAPHDLSVIDFLIDDMPDRVLATGSSHTVKNQVDIAYLNLDFGHGLIANLHVNWLSPVKVRRMIFGGDRKMIIYDELSTNEKVRVYDMGAAPIEVTGDAEKQRLRRTDFRTGDIWTPHLPQREALGVEAANIAAAIMKSTPLRADGRAGLRVVRLLEACQKSLGDQGARVLLTKSSVAYYILGHERAIGSDVPAKMRVPYSAECTETLPWPSKP